MFYKTLKTKKIVYITQKLKNKILKLQFVFIFKFYSFIWRQQTLQNNSQTNTFSSIFNPTLFLVSSIEECSMFLMKYLTLLNELLTLFVVGIITKDFQPKNYLPNNEEEFQFLIQLDISLWQFDLKNHQQQNSLTILYTVACGRLS